MGSAWSYLTRRAFGVNDRFIVSPTTSKGMADGRPREEGASHPPSELIHQMVRSQESMTKEAENIVALCVTMSNRQRELERENQRYKDSLSQVAKDRTRMNQSAAENIESKNRPSVLEAKYRDFYDHERMDAIGIIESSRKKTDQSKNTERDDERIACLIFEHAYEEAENLRDNFERFITRILTLAPSVGARYQEQMSREETRPKANEAQFWSSTLESEAHQQGQLEQDIVNSLKFMMKETSHICDATEIAKRTKDILRQRKETGRLGDYKKNLLTQLEGYIHKCCEFAWKLVCQNPPYVLKGQASFPGTPNTPQSGVPRVLWPGLEEGAGTGTGRVIALAVVEMLKY